MFQKISHKLRKDLPCALRKAERINDKFCADFCPWLHSISSQLTRYRLTLFCISSHPLDLGSCSGYRPVLHSISSHSLDIDSCVCVEWFFFSMARFLVKTSLDVESLRSISTDSSEDFECFPAFLHFSYLLRYSVDFCEITQELV